MMGHGPKNVSRAGRPGAKNPGKTFARILREIGSRYALQCVLVLVCIVVTAVANVRGTRFTQSLIDDYILPMLGS